MFKESNLIRGSELEQLNISSAQNRNMFISFLLFCLYMLAITAGSTHFDILFDRSSKIPLLGLELSISDFYIYAPIILLIFHIDILYNIEKHIEKLADTDNINNKNIYPYIVNFAFLNSIWLKRFIFLMMFGSGNMVLVYILFKFNVTHNIVIYYWHLFLIILDFIALFIIFRGHYINRMGRYFMIIPIILILVSFFITPSLSLLNTEHIEHKNVIIEDLTKLSLIKFIGKKIDFRDNIIKNSVILTSTITYSYFQKVDFSESRISDSNLSNNRFYDINFRKSKIVGVDFSNSKFDKIDFTGATLTDVNFCGSSFNKIKIDNKYRDLINGSKCR